MKLNVLIVNPGSSGKMIRPALEEQNINCDALYCVSGDPTRMLDYQNQSSYRHLYHSVADVLSNPYAVKYNAVISGSELGVEYCDDLASKLGLAGNDPKTTYKRRHKMAMQEALKDHGLNYIQSLIVNMDSQTEAIVSLFSAQSYIIKPVNAAGSEHIYHCKDKKSVIEAVYNLPWGEMNCTGNRNEEFIVQEFISGDEYALDFIVVDKNPTLMALCLYDKGEGENNLFAYKGLKLLDPNLAQFKVMIDYAKSAISALDISYGPVHMEIIEHHGIPVMIEAATRLHGGIAPALFYHCYQPDLLKGLVQLIIAPKQIPSQAVLCRPGHVYFHCCQSQGIFKGIPEQIMAQILALNAVMGLKVLIKVGDTYNVTENLFDCPIIVWLAHQSETQIESDITRIKLLLTPLF